MSGVITDNYLSNLLKDWKKPSGNAHPWLNQLRTEALDCVSTLRMPLTSDEEWRFTNIASLTALPFHEAPSTPKLNRSNIEHFYLEDVATRLVFIDGQYAPQLSSDANESGVIVGNLSILIDHHSSQIVSQLGQHTDYKNNVFAALNTAFLKDSAVVIIPRNTTATAAIHLLFIATQAEVTSYPRCLLIAEPNSQATIIEDYVAQQDLTYVTNSVTEVSLADNAHINHIRVQRDSGHAFHMADCSVSQARSSHYQSMSVALGANISRLNLNIQLEDENAECSVDGLALIKDRQLADTHTVINHIKPHGTSRQLHKCIVGGEAHAVFNGRIMVRPHAQRTDSTQTNRNLLLTSKAQVNTKPQLEIFADDVKCAHGATVGQLDPDEIFYLRSRGLSEIDARNLLTYAFGAEIIDRIPVASLKKQLEQIVLKHTQRTAS